MPSHISPFLFHQDGRMQYTRGNNGQSYEKISSGLSCHGEYRRRGKVDGKYGSKSVLEPRLEKLQTWG